jgi:hypothetical protein
MQDMVLGQLLVPSVCTTAHSMGGFTCDVQSGRQNLQIVR